MLTSQQTNCIFCTPKQEHIFFRDDLVYGLWDAHPVSKGHALLILKKHIESWFEATQEEQLAILQGIEIAKEKIDKQYQPDGFNIGMNIGASAGQTISHLHVHIIPRYKGDINDPRGGVRHVIPHKANYLADPFGHRLSLTQVPHTNALISGANDPLLPHLLTHIDLAEQVDIAVAFTRDSGVRCIKDHLQDLLDRGGKIRFVTGDYMGITEPHALQSLLDLRGNITFRIYETTNHSFHPKAYIFRNKLGGGVALVGSSNLSAMALGEGVEWNYRTITTRDQWGYNNVVTTFEALFQSQSTVSLDDSWIESYQKRRSPISPNIVGEEEEPLQDPPEPHDIQIEAMAALDLSRQSGNQAGLVVLATGLGKTWLSAFDSNRNEFKRILFVAHRDEILSQARQTFRQIQPNAQLGYYTGQQKDKNADILFASVQTLSRAYHLHNFDPSDFDYIIVDEFHHASASTYRKLIDYFDPKFLLGLTATPERTDGGDLLRLCQENIVYSCNLLQGIQRDLLCPFHYFGVPDNVDYDQIPWRSNKFDERELTEHVATEQRAQNVLEQYQDKAGKRTLAFCCSTLHADFMKTYFQGRGIKAAAVHSDHNTDPRTASLSKLASGELDIIFSVDMFNEGLDIPSVDTVMMLRPTESRLLWLQQLGRGLRKSEDKTHLTVIDYIGNHKTFLTKYRAFLEVFMTLSPGLHPLRQQLNNIRNKTLELPPNCHVTYDLEVVDVLHNLLGSQPSKQQESLDYFYEDFRDRHVERPLAAETFHEGYNPKSVQKEYGFWFHFVRSKGDLTKAQEELLSLDPIAAFLTHVENTSMPNSSKMLLLLAMLNGGGFPRGIDIDQLTRHFARLAKRSARLRSDIGVPTDDLDALQSFLEENPIDAWTTGGIKHFTYKNNMFQPTFDIPEQYHENFCEFVRELVDWRLAEYLSREGFSFTKQIICKVSHSQGHPILFLPDRSKQLDIPEGWQKVTAEGQNFEANFVKIAVNVLRKPGTKSNELHELMRNWFGEDAGLPGTAHRVIFTAVDNGFRLEPLGVKNTQQKLDLWSTFTRSEVPPLFGLQFNRAAWERGYVYKDNHIFLFVTLGKQQLHRDFQYQDRFISPDHFQWQSQNSTSQHSTTGQRLSQHKEKDINVHLFVRETKMRGKKAAPFIYCGEVDFISWEGEKPITIQWHLQNPIPDNLRQRLNVPNP